jgi:hypothetical protein
MFLSVVYNIIDTGDLFTLLLKGFALVLLDAPLGTLFTFLYNPYVCFVYCVSFEERG